MGKICRVWLIILLSFLLSGCLSEEDKKAKELYLEAEQSYKKKEYAVSVKALEAYMKNYPKGEDFKKAQTLLTETKEAVKKQEAINEKETENNDRKKIVSDARKIIDLPENKRLMDHQTVKIVDNIPGDKHITLAMYIKDPSKGKMIVAIDDFYKQSSGWRFIIYFVKDINYQIVNRRNLEHKVIGVYASYPKKLQILNSAGNVVEDIRI